MSPRARLTFHQVFVRDRFDGDGGVPLNIINLPGFTRDANFGLPQDRVLVEDSQTTRCSPARWRRDGSCAIRSASSEPATSISSPKACTATRAKTSSSASRSTSITSGGPCRTRRRLSAVSAVLARTTCCSNGEYHRDRYRTEVTAGDDPDCICGWWMTIAPMDITTMAETQGPLDIDTVARTTFVNDRTQAFYLQDQIDLTPQIKVNLGYRLDDYKRDITRTGGLPFTPQ